jgi:hypothetical protein
MPRHVLLSVFLSALLLGAPASAAAQASTPTSSQASPPLVYHQITSLEEGTGGVGQPVLSADGNAAVFADAPGDPNNAENPNHISVVGADGAGLTEVDAYTPHCYCGSWVDISADGETVVSSESMQLRLVRGGAEARTLVDLASNELSSLRLTAAGDRVFFLLARDTQLVGASDTLQRGIYAVDADGNDLRQIAGPDQIAQLLGVKPDEVQMLRLQVNALDVAADGSRIVFGAYVGAEQAVFAADGDGRDLHQILDSLAFVQRVAISGDGALVAYDVVPLETPSDNNEVGVIPTEGGEPRATGTNSGFDDPLQLSDDGSRLLVSPNSYLIDTESGATRQLAILTPGIDGHTALLVDGMSRATMDAEAERFLYVFRGARCADCPNQHEQLATLDIGPADLGDAPTIASAEIDPAEIPLNYAAAATANAAVDAAGTLLTVGLVALREGQTDINVGRDAILHDDGQNGDVTAGDGIFTNNAVVHVGAVAREDDTGPRMLRIQAETETSDGRRHATAVEFGPLTVVAGP